MKITNKHSNMPHSLESKNFGFHFFTECNDYDPLLQKKTFQKSFLFSSGEFHLDNVKASSFAMNFRLLKITLEWFSLAFMAHFWFKFENFRIVSRITNVFCLGFHFWYAHRLPERWRGNKGIGERQFAPSLKTGHGFGFKVTARANCACTICP